MSYTKKGSNNRLSIRTDEIKAISQDGLEQVIKELKGDVLTLVHDAGSGHCGGSLSLIRALFMYYRNVHQEGRQMHLSEGHCVPALYAIGHRFGDISDEEMEDFRRIKQIKGSTSDNRRVKLIEAGACDHDDALWVGLSGHADKRVQLVPSGLLGQGPGVANGMARAGRIIAGTNGVSNSIEKKVYCFCGDGETDEGAVWEAVEAAVNSNLNVCYVINNNEKNLSGSLVNDFDAKEKAMRGFGIHVIGADNTLDSLTESYKSAEAYHGPVAIIVRSTKGEGVSFMENEQSGWHGNPLTDEQYAASMKELGLEAKTFRTSSLAQKPQPPHHTSSSIVVTDDKRAKAISSLKEKGLGLTEAPTRKANELFAELGNEDDKLVVLIPDIGKSVVMDKFAKAHPQRFFDVGIKEMEATLEAMGLSASGFKPIVSTFDGFTYIPFSAIRMADYGGLNVGFVFTHAEFIGEDGPSHLMTENLGAWLGLHNIGAIANPADIVQAKQIIKDCVKEGEMFYIRLGRPNVPTIYAGRREVPMYEIADILRYHHSSEDNMPHVQIITTGQEVWESLIAAEMLLQENISPQVVNVAYFKPFDAETIRRHCCDHIFVVEAHNPKTGLASLVSSALVDRHCDGKRLGIKSFTSLGIEGYVPSGTIEEQKKHCGLLGEQIYQRIREQIKK
ncbi:hypothetical protein J4434_07070 [Candidatus Woesearchaeota archaeon]|nr:hypothetical protein [Candidatus Woesearchaeota archaeon]